MNAAEQTRARIERKNRAFRRLGVRQRRVAIAKDVISMLVARKIKATHGLYVGMDDRAKQKVREAVGRDLGELIPTMPVCHACALGSMFLAAVTRADDMTVVAPVVVAPDNEPPLIDRSRECRILDRAGLSFFQHGSYDYLQRFFSKDQLHEIESAFEHARSYGGSWLSKLDRLGPRQRILKIMRNVVRNKGTFVYEQLV